VRPDDASADSRALEAYIAARNGERVAALAMVKRLQLDRTAAHFLLYELAKVYAALNDPGQAVEYLRQAVDERSAQVVFMAIDPELAPLREDARFQPLAQRVGIARGR
jgi:predicted Zn-dependent protease